MSVHDLDQKAQAALLLARGTTTDKTGETVGVSGRTVRRWLEDPGFRTDVEAARSALLEEAVRALAGAARDAVTALHSALTDESSSIRVQAAKALLNSLPALTEHFDLERRIDAIEQALAEAREAA